MPQKPVTPAVTSPALRHQLNVLRRASPQRPVFSNFDRMILTDMVVEVLLVLAGSEQTEAGEPIAQSQLYRLSSLGLGLRLIIEPSIKSHSHISRHVCADGSRFRPSRTACLFDLHLSRLIVPQPQPALRRSLG